jgi:uncharacterized protein YjbI with pentapeptide repeats
MTKHNVKELKELKERWNEELGNENFAISFFCDLENGLKDYRASSVSSGFFNQTIDKCDFSYAKFKRGILASSITYSNFEKVSGISNIGNKIYNSNFTAIKFNGTNFLGEWNGNSFELCDLKKVSSGGGSNAVFNGNSFNQSKFLDCTFHQAHFENCIFRNCIFSNCAFTEAKFFGCQFIDCDFKKYLGLNDVIFENCGVSKETFSSAGDLVDYDTVYG